MNHLQERTHFLNREHQIGSESSPVLIANIFQECQVEVKVHPCLQGISFTKRNTADLCMAAFIPLKSQWPNMNSGSHKNNICRICSNMCKVKRDWVNYECNCSTVDNFT